MADDDADKTGECHAEGDKNHRDELRVVDSMLLPEAGVHCAACGDKADAGVVDCQTDGEADSDGQREDEVGAQRLILPLKDRAVGEEPLGCRWPGNGRRHEIKDATRRAQ